MLTLRELLYSFTGIWWLLKGQPEGMALIRRDREGFWNSYTAAWFLLLPYSVDAWLEYGLLKTEMPFMAFFTVKLLIFLLSWTAFPLLMVHIGRALEWKEERYLGFLAALNWSYVIQFLPFYTLSIAMGGKITYEFFELYTLAFTVYQAFIARAGLLVTWFVAAGVALLILNFHLMFLMLGAVAVQ